MSTPLVSECCGARADEASAGEVSDPYTHVCANCGLPCVGIEPDGVVTDWRSQQIGLGVSRCPNDADNEPEYNWFEDMLRIARGEQPLRPVTPINPADYSNDCT